ncbi:MAG: hypothetical protein M5U31_04985 [Acidimicrobiia bacterium]|nr:hypothetical protein [Acidimicrobiia bacterium]
MAVTYVAAHQTEEGPIVVEFLDSTRPAWRVRVHVERWVEHEPEHDDDPADPWPGKPTYTRTACTKVEFDFVGDEPSRLRRPGWRSSRSGSCIDQAASAARDFELEDSDNLPPLPRGFPQRGGPAWYGAFLQAIEAWAAMGVGTPMEIYRQVARRKRVPVNRVKQWAFQARKLRSEGKLVPAASPMIVGSCAGCQTPIIPGSVGVIDGDLPPPLLRSGRRKP